MKMKTNRRKVNKYTTQIIKGNIRKGSCKHKEWTNAINELIKKGTEKDRTRLMKMEQAITRNQ